MNKVKLFIFCFFALISTYSTLWAQVPNLMNYQGVALNSSGTPIANTTIKLKVKIHTGTPTGTVQYYEERSVTTDATGLFDFQIDGPGKLIGAGTLASVTWSSGDKFLHIEMDPTNGNTFTDMGTQQLVTVPYAKVAEKFTLPFAGTDASLKTFEITNTLAGGKAIVANANSTASAIEANQTGSGNAITASNNSGGVSAMVVTNTSGTAITANGSPISSSDGVLEVNATATAGYAILAQSGGSSGTIRATNSNTSNGVSAIYGEANNVGQNGVKGISINGRGIYGTSVNNAGVFGVSDNTVGVQGFSLNGIGVEAGSTNGKALYAAGFSEFDGTIKITGGNPGVGKVLTSDASGNATWQNNKIGFVASYDYNMFVYLNGGSFSTIPLMDSYDAGNSFNNKNAASDPNTFIAPVSGLYSFSAYVSIYGGVVYDFTYMGAALYINGIASFTHNSFGLIDANNASVDFNQRIHLNAGDKVSLKVRHDKTINTTSLLNATEFSGVLVFAD